MKRYLLLLFTLILYGCNPIILKRSAFYNLESGPVAFVESPTKWSYKVKTDSSNLWKLKQEVDTSRTEKYFGKLLDSTANLLSKAFYLGKISDSLKQGVDSMISMNKYKYFLLDNKSVRMYEKNDTTIGYFDYNHVFAVLNSEGQILTLAENKPTAHKYSDSTFRRIVKKNSDLMFEKVKSHLYPGEPAYKLIKRSTHIQTDTASFQDSATFKVTIYRDAKRIKAMGTPIYVFLNKTYQLKFSIESYVTFYTSSPTIKLWKRYRQEEYELRPNQTNFFEIKYPYTSNSIAIKPNNEELDKIPSFFKLAENTKISF